jgi:hemoglobin
MKDIESIDDVKFLVDHFYAKVQVDDLLGPIFNSRLEGRWEQHHKRLYRFWNTILLRKPDYYGKPVEMHFDMNIGGEHFSRWLEIWNETVQNNFEGTIAERALLRGKTMAMAFLEKIEKHRQKSWESKEN